jgi:hypothetical protein
MELLLAQLGGAKGYARGLVVLLLLVLFPPPVQEEARLMCWLKLELGPRRGRSHCLSREWSSSNVGRRWGISAQHSTMRAYIRGGQRSGQGSSWRERIISITSWLL